MTVYIINILLIMLYGLLYTSLGKTEKGKTAFLWVVFIQLTLLMALRDFSVGLDVQNYADIYVGIANRSLWATLSMSQYSDIPVYVIYCKLLSLLSPDPRLWLVCSAVLINGVVLWFIRRNSRNVVMSVLYYILFLYFNESMSATRQFLAIAALLAAYDCISRDKTLKGCLLIAMATLTHNTAMVFFIVPLIKWVVRSRKVMALFCAACAAGMLLFERLVFWFVTLMPRYAMYTDGIGRYFYKDSVTSNSNAIIYILLAVVLTAWVVFDKNRDAGLADVSPGAGKSGEFLLLTCIISVAVINGLLLKDYVVAIRIGWYFSVFCIVYIPFVVEEMPKMRTMIYYLSILAMMTYMVLRLYAANIDGTVPYKLMIL